MSPATRIEVVTEGILTRMIQSDPGLEGIGAVIFDEFHERSLAADLGLALAWESRGALRDDLILLVMSATLDAEPVAALLDDAPVVTSRGQAFPVETRWLDRPLPPRARIEESMADLIARAAAEAEGGILAFLPGEGEIRRVASRLDLADCDIRPLYGALGLKAQQEALAPAARRKVVLATAIAETSLTIPDIRVVVDGGLARRARFDPASGMSRLVTERVTRAEAEQRRGRAGRVAPGLCYRLWTKGQEGALAAQPPAEIEAADLADLALELALWGDRDGAGLAFLTPPPPGALAEAQALLRDLGALGADGAITAHGRTLAGLPLHPRLGHMLALAGPDAAPLAALLADRDPLRGAGADLSLRLDALSGARAGQGADPRHLDRIRVEARRLARAAGSRAGPARPDLPDDPGERRAAMAALAYPDRIGLRRPGDAPRYLLSGGKGAALDPADPLAGARLIVVTDTDGDPREARIRQAAPIAEATLRDLFADRIAEVAICDWSRRERRVVARLQERLGALVLADRPWRDAPPERVSAAMCDGVREIGLVWTEAARRLRARVELARADGADLPAMGDAQLMETLDTWLAPHLPGIRSEAAWRAVDLTAALEAMLDWPQRQTLDRVAPPAYETPLGRRVPIDYDGDQPAIALRLQEMFGVTQHPVVAGRPLLVTLLSPAGRPVQTTADLPGFWATSYADVRRDMRGRYPRHPWPENPAEAAPTRRVKPRG